MIKIQQIVTVAHQHAQLNQTTSAPVEQLQVRIPVLHVQQDILQIQVRLHAKQYVEMVSEQERKLEMIKILLTVMVALLHALSNQIMFALVDLQQTRILVQLVTLAILQTVEKILE